MAIETPLESFRGRVLPDWIDFNGHMNVAYYLVAFDLATDIFLDYAGLDKAYRDTTGGTTFSAEIHISYHRELQENAPLSISTQLLSFDEKRIRYLHRMFHEEEGIQAATAENLSLHVDLNQRRVVPLPGQIMDRLKEILEAHRELGVPQEAGGAIIKPQLK